MDKNLHDIDALFTENLEGETAQPSGHVWDAIEAGLNQRDLKTMQRKNRRLKWLSGLLVILLTTSLVWLYQSRNKPAAPGTAASGHANTAWAMDTGNATVQPPANTQPNAAQQNSLANAPASAKPDTPSDNSKTALVPPTDPTVNKQVTAPQTPQPITKSNSNPVAQPNQAPLPMNRQTPLVLNRATKNIHGTAKSPKPAAGFDKGTLPDTQSNDLVNNPTDLTERPKQPSKTNKRFQATIKPADATAEDVTVGATSNEDATGYTLPPAVNQPLRVLDKSLPSKLLDLQSAMGPQLSKQVNKKGHDNRLSFSIAPYYAINWFTAKVNNGRLQHREDNQNEIKQREQPNNHSNEPSYGLLATASLNDRWALQTGLGLVSITKDISSHTLYARQHQAPGGGGPSQGPGFKFNCTAGTVYFTSKLINTNPNVGDSLDVLQPSSRLQYLQVPISLRYTLFKRGGLQLYALAGATANLLTRGQVNATITNGTINEKVSANSIDGLNKLYWGLHIGTGIEYPIGKRLGLYLSPTYNVGITPINKETPVSTRLGQLSLVGGLRLRLGK